MSLLKSFASKYLSNAYSSIDTLPIQNWNDAHTYGDLSHIKRFQFLPCRNIEEKWHVLKDQYIARIGLSKDFKERILEEAAIEELRLDAYITGNRKLLTIADIREIELKSISETGQSFDLDSCIAMMEEFFKFQIDPRTTSVVQYYKRVNLMSDRAKELEKKRNKVKS